MIFEKYKPSFAAWLADKNPSEWVLLGEAYGRERFSQGVQSCRELNEFEDWLKEVFKREVKQ